ncbi:MAG: glycoside hydrolase family 125 protein [Candidatus Eremiobacteraeota bacterium]|nr:glycoside hydrolase family 125 protein [Candidatus Eremiobacteraeota bacterium]
MRLTKAIVRGLLCTLAALALLAPRPAPAIELDALSKAAASYTVGDPKLQSLYRAALLNTNKQVTVASDGTVYVKTGDIPAEWLRDASVQVRPYLFFVKNDPQIAALLRGAIARMGKYLQVEPYANAFTLDYRVWEKKFELDSLAYPMTLAWTYWKQTGDASIFTGDLSLGFDAALATMEREQDHPRNDSKYFHKEMPNGGKGNPVAYTGMIWSGFRPSDDACTYNFLIPSEMMAVVALGNLEEIERDVYHNVVKAQRAKTLRREVQNGIQTYGVHFLPNYGYIYAYEVDGLGNKILMDDANVPSLLSAPYLGYTKSSSFVYRNTRKFLLSKDNPTYYVGKLARGIGSLHTSDNYVWPIAMLMQGFTASSDSERKDVLSQLLASDPGDHLLHESFNPDDPTRFTRADFGWPNALFSEYVMTTFEGVPALPVGSTMDLGFSGD